ncbi:MAG: PAS domain-containing protein, partial [Bacteroidetes bacterium]
MNNALQLANVIPLHASEASSFLFEGNTFFDLYERLLQSAPDFIYTVNSNGFFSFVNSRSAELTGYNRNELVEMRYLDIVAP